MSRTRKENVPEKSLEASADNEVKKRRVRKKKPRKQNLEKDEATKDVSERRESAPTNSADDGVKFVKRRNKTFRKDRFDSDSSPTERAHVSEIPDSPTAVEQVKYNVERRNNTIQRNSPELESASTRCANDSEIPKASGPVECSKKYAKRRNKFVRNDGPDRDSGVTKRNDNSEKRPSNAVQQDKEVKRRNKPVNSGLVNNSREIPGLSGVIEEVKVVKNHNRGAVSRDVKEIGLNPESCRSSEEEKCVKKHNRVVTSSCSSDTRENVDADEKVRDVKSSGVFENAICLVVDEKTSRWGKMLPGKRYRPRQGHNGDDFLGKACGKDVTKDAKHSDELQRQKPCNSEAKKESTVNETNHKEDTCKVESSEGCGKKGSRDFPARRRGSGSFNRTAKRTSGKGTNRRITKVSRLIKFKGATSRYCNLSCFLGVAENYR